MFVNRVADNTKNKNIIKFYLFTKYINKTSMYKLYYLKCSYKKIMTASLEVASGQF